MTTTVYYYTLTLTRPLIFVSDDEGIAESGM